MSAPAPVRPPHALAHAAAPLRGTQSLVAVMAGVWSRPGLMALEVLWRWTAGAPILFLLLRAVAHAVRHHPVDAAALEAMTVFQPLAAVDTLGRQLLPYLPVLSATARWLAPLGVLAWVASATLGRAAILRRLDPVLPIRPAGIALFSLLRLLLLLGTLLLWVRGIVAVAHYSIAKAVAAGGEPNLVLFAALVVGLTLALLLLWCVTVWVLDAAPFFALAEATGPVASVRSALRAGALRSKLVEINLVMSIVKVGLTVLAMVFMATPLPFAAEETRSFLVGWWTVIGLLFLVALDFFHVVRRAANLSFFRTLVRPTADTTSDGEHAY